MTIKFSDFGKPVTIEAPILTSNIPPAPAATPPPPPTPVIALVPAPASLPTIASPTPAPVLTLPPPPSLLIDPNKSYTAVFELEKGGEFVIELAAKDAPITVNNFVYLSRAGFYDNVTFHRVIPGFMAQSGDPTGTGSGGPDYRFQNEFSPNLRHDAPGVISMANAGIRNGEATNGGQFFIIYVPTLLLDGLNPDGSLKNCA
ncbi:MAG: peptidylprolyl isomerase, partial [Chloroflexi bacterium]|nr:peptidylprolyl isomerase [Chloroflexota bacterium]